MPLLFRAGLLVGLSLWFAAPAMAQPAPDSALRFDTVLDAVRSHPGVRAGRLHAAALATRSAQVSALPDPTVMVAYQPLPVLTARGYQRSQWRVEQPIPYPGKRALRGDIADLSAAVAEAETDVYLADLVYEAKRAYYDLYRVQAQTELIDAFRERLASFEAIATTQYEVGTGPQQAVLKAQVEAGTLGQRLAMLDAQRRTALETLARVTNRPGWVAAPDVHVTLPPIPDVPTEELLALAEQQRAEAAALALAEARAEARVALAETAWKPDFGVSLTYVDIGAADMPPTADGRDAVMLGVTVKVPVQRARIRAGIEEAQLEAQAVGARQEALRSVFATTIADALGRMRSEAAQRALYTDTLIPQAEATLEATLSAYTTGRTGFLDLLDAERVLFTLRTGLADATVRYLSAAALLERALGVTDLADLDLR